MKRVLLLIILIVFLLIGCISKDTILENKKWVLMEIEGDSEIVNVNDRRAYIEFDLESDKISGNLTCNNFFADYHINGLFIDLGAIATTKMICADNTAQEYRFIHALNRIDSYKLEEDKLFFYEGDRLILVFK